MKELITSVNRLGLAAAQSHAPALLEEYGIPRKDFTNYGSLEAAITTHRKLAEGIYRAIKVGMVLGELPDLQSALEKAQAMFKTLSRSGQQLAIDEVASGELYQIYLHKPMLNDAREILVEMGLSL